MSRPGWPQYYLAVRHSSETNGYEGIWSKGPSIFFWSSLTGGGSLGGEVSLLELFHRVSSTKEHSSDELYKLSLVL